MILLELKPATSRIQSKQSNQSITVLIVLLLFFTENPSLDAWLGAKKWVTSSSVGNVWITRQDYEEKGGQYLKEHAASNRYLPHPVLVQKWYLSILTCNRRPVCFCMDFIIRWVSDRRGTLITNQDVFLIICIVEILNLCLWIVPRTYMIESWYSCISSFFKLIV